MKLTKIPYSQEYYGAGDGKAINSHSQREYSIAGSDKILVVDRNNSISPPIFHVWYKPDPKYRGIIKYHAPEIADKGEGISWAKFIKLLEEELMPAP